MEHKPNAFSALELDPSITDWSIIESVIQSKKRSWSMHKNQGTPAQKRKAELFLKYITDFETVLKDPESRKQELKAFHQEKKKEKQARFKELDGLIEIIQDKTIPKTLIKKLVAQTGKVFTEKEVEDRLKQKGITLETAQARKKGKSARPQLDASVAKGIRGELESLGQKNLYDFLNIDHSPGLSKRSSVAGLYERADKIYKDLSTGKTDRESTLKMSLAGHAKAVFSGDKEKTRYDNSYEAEALLELHKPFEIAGLDGFIQTGEIEKLLLAGKKLGIAENAVLEYMHEYAEKRKWVVQKETEPIRVPLQACGYCGEIATFPQDKRCNVCGEALTQPCPKCGTQTPTEYAACSECGCHTGDAPLVKSLLEEGKKHARNGDYDTAISRINKALDYWGNWQPALDEKRQAKARKKESFDALSQIRSLIKERKLESADSKLDQYRHKFGSSSTTMIQNQIHEGLKEAKTAFESAEKFRTDGQSERAFDRYEESLSYCADFNPAISRMAQSPPTPPADVSSQWKGDVLRLSWRPANARGNLSYTVVRKTQGLPSNLNDGDVIAQTNVTQVDDADIKPGCIYYYGIFSVRSGTPSKAFADSGPHLLIEDITKLEYQPGNRQVSITWQSPVGSSGVEVWRREGLAPSRRGEGKKMVLSGRSLLDSELENERRYGYLIVTKYRHPANASSTLYSDGVRVLATPVAPPQPVNDLTIRRNDKTVFLTWTAVSGKAQVQIRQAQSIPEFTPGEILSLSDANRFGAPIPLTVAGKTQTTLKTQGRVFFTPLTVLSETAVLGKPVSVTTLDEVSGLMSKRNGSSIILTWGWPQGAKEVVAAYSHVCFPSSPEDSGVAMERVTRQDYDNKGYWELRSAGHKKHYFSVFNKDPSVEVFSSGVTILETMGQERTVRYRVIAKKNILSRKLKAAWVEFLSDINHPLEGLRVVFKPKYPPVSKSDGVVVASVDRITFVDGMSKIDIPATSLNYRGYLKVFFDNDDAAKETRLLPSSKDKLRLN